MATVVADRTITLAEGLDRPHGIAYHDGALYVAEHGRLIRLPARDSALGPDDIEVVVPNLPINPGNGHWTRTLAIAQRHGVRQRRLELQRLRGRRAAARGRLAIQPRRLGEPVLRAAYATPWAIAVDPTRGTPGRP